MKNVVNNSQISTYGSRVPGKSEVKNPLVLLVKAIFTEMMWKTRVYRNWNAICKHYNGFS